MTKFNKKAYYDYLQSNEWKKIRHIVAEKSNYKCEICNKKCEDLDTLLGFQIHHTTYENLFNEQNHLNDLQFLCQDCHFGIAHLKSKKKKRPKKTNYEDNISAIIIRYNKTKTLLNKFKVIHKYAYNDNVRTIIQNCLNDMFTQFKQLEHIDFNTPTTMITKDVDNINKLNFKCKYCKNPTYKIKKHKINVGLYCQKCGKWHKFFTKDEIEKLKL